MNLGERQDIPNTDFVKAGHDQKILGSKIICLTGNGGYGWVESE